MKRLLLLTLVIFYLLTFLPFQIGVSADELGDISAKLEELQKSLSSSEAATANNEKQLAGLTTQLDQIKSQVSAIENNIIEKEKDITKGEAMLIQQKKILDSRVASFYKHKGRSKDALLQVILSDNLSTLLKQFTYQQNLLNDDRTMIVRVVLQVQDI